MAAIESPNPGAMLTKWQELRLDLEPTSNGKIVQIRLPDKSTFSRSSKGSRRVLDTYAACKSEDEYRKRHVALSAGMFFRSVEQFPRNILWRCLGDGHTLEVRSIDLSRAKPADPKIDAPTILQFTFPSTIRKECVGFAESEHGRSFDVFVLTENKDLYTLRLPSSWFTSVDKSDEDPETWYRIARPGTLALGQVLRLGSATSRELLFAMTDGRTIRLTRQPDSDGSSWVESAYSDGQWSSLRGLIPWQGANKIRYEGQSLDPSAAVAVLPSPDGRHLITITLSHTLRIWNVESGKPVYEKDILNSELETDGTTKFTLDPGHKNVLALVPGSQGSDYYIFTYSPHEGGKFKIWHVIDADLGGVTDMVDDQALRVPDPEDNAVWTLADYKVAIETPSGPLSIWVMLRLNRRYQVYYRRFTSIATVATEWLDDWERTNIQDQVVLADSTIQSLVPAEPLGLALDNRGLPPWLLSTNSVSLVRTCSETELLTLNIASDLVNVYSGIANSVEVPGESPNLPFSELASLIDIAERFRSGLAVGPLQDAVRSELWQDALKPPEERMQQFYITAFEGRVSDGAYRELEDPQITKHLSDDLFEAILATFPQETVERNDRRGLLPHTGFGRKTLVIGAQGMIRTQERIISDLLYLLVFIDQEGVEDGFNLRNLHTAAIFDELVTQLRQIQVVQWLAWNRRTTGGRSIILLEETVARGIEFRADEETTDTAQSSVTESIRDLMLRSARGDAKADHLDGMTISYASWLLRHGEVGLVTSFLQYLPSTAGGKYLLGRFYVLVQNYASAAICFKKAAHILSGQTHGEFFKDQSRPFLNPVEQGYIGNGLAKYYTHIVELFAAPSVSAHAQAALFASLALQHPDTYKHGESAVQHKSELLTRLFHASLSLGDFDAAFAALTRYTDKALRKAAVKDLVGTMIAADAVRDLLQLPFTEGLKKVVDDILASRARSENASEQEISGAVKVLYAWRIKRGDYRGAAACLVEKLQKRRPRGQKRPRVKASGAKDGILDDYLISINALSLLGHSEGVEEAENEGWLFVEKEGDGGSRSLVRLKDLRREYQDEMDRREKWEMGRFALTAAVDDEDDDGDAVMAT